MSLSLRRSLRLRLIIGSAVGVLLSTLLAALFIGNLYRIHTTDRFEAELDHHLAELISMTRVDASGMPYVAPGLSDPQFNAEGAGLYWQIDAGSGRVARSVSLGAHHLQTGTLDVACITVLALGILAGRVAHLGGRRLID